MSWLPEVVPIENTRQLPNHPLTCVQVIPYKKEEPDKALKIADAIAIQELALVLGWRKGVAYPENTFPACVYRYSTYYYVELQGEPQCQSDPQLA